MEMFARTSQVPPAPPQPSPPDSSAVAVRPELVFGLRPISVGTPFSFITI